MITIIDYGMGNLRSVSKALEHLGAKVRISSEPKDLEKTEKIVLPGVGAFGDAIHELERVNLFRPIQDAIREKKKFLGICLGLQLLLGSSEESPGVQGLEIFPGSVKLFRSKDVKVPHMGWNSVELTQEHPLLKGLKNGDSFYFVHSFYAMPENLKLTAASCCYGSETFPAMLGTESVFATQFHPEKSQEAGLKILKNFVEW